LRFRVIVYVCTYLQIHKNVKCSVPPRGTSFYNTIFFLFIKKIVIRYFSARNKELFFAEKMYASPQMAF
jgi:hypothetical protein